MAQLPRRAEADLHGNSVMKNMALQKIQRPH